MRVMVLCLRVVCGLMLASTACVSYTVNAQEIRSRGQASGASSATSENLRMVLRGVVLDGVTGEPLAGATVQVAGTLAGTFTDAQGRYALSVPVESSGEIMLRISYVGFQEKTVSGIQLLAGRESTVSVSLNALDVTTDEVVIEERVEISTDLAIVLSQRFTPYITDNLSGDMIVQTSPALNTSTIIQRLPGVSLSDEQFLVVRGLADRYNLVLFNGGLVPGADLERFGFDLGVVPSNLISQLKLIKSRTADQFGELAGGALQIVTEVIPAASGWRASYRLGYTEHTSFQEVVRREPDSRILGILPRVKSYVPDGFASTQQVQGLPQDSPELAELGRGLNSASPQPQTHYAGPAQNYTLEYRKKWDTGKAEAGLVAALAYVEDWLTSDWTQEIVSFYSPALDESPTTDSSSNRQYRHRQNAVGMLNLGLRTPGGSTLQWQNLLAYATENFAYTSFGSYTNPSINPGFSEYYYPVQRFQNRQVVSSQLSGDHKLVRAKGLRLGWLTNFSYQFRDEPGFFAANYARFDQADPLSFEPLDEDFELYALTFTGNQQEVLLSQRLDVTYPVKVGRADVKWQSGLYGSWAGSRLRSRVLGLILPLDASGALATDLPAEVLALDNVQNVFDPANIRPGGFFLRERTSPSNNYDADTWLAAAYTQADVTLTEELRAIAGVRLEYFEQHLDSRWNGATQKITDRVQTEWLPNAQLIYSFAEKSQLRVGYYRSIDRPEVRELSDLDYFNVDIAYRSLGNSNLVSSQQDNIDLRFETFYLGANLFSVTAFYKYINNPVERFITEGSVDVIPQYSLVNRNAASVGGLEVEFRQSLTKLLPTQAWAKHLSVYTNAAIFRSRVDTGNGVAIFSEGRRLQGQADYLINAGLLWKDFSEKFTLNLFYNIVGPRLSIAGIGNESTQLYPDLIESSRSTLEFQAAWQLNARAKLQLQIPDLITQRQLIFQEYDGLQGQDGDGRKTVRSVRPAYQANVTLSVKF